MIFQYKYAQESKATHSSRATGIQFSPNLIRKPTFFEGTLNQHIPFREAISTLHHVVTSNLKFVPKDRTDYEEWLKAQELFWIEEFSKQGQSNNEELQKVRTQLQEAQREWKQVMGPFNEAKLKYFRHIHKKNLDLWFVLDPVITVHPDELFFECFSEDESTYGKLSCSYEGFDQMGALSYGTTNIDYSENLYKEFQKIRTYKATKLAVDPSGFEMKTQGEADFKELKIDLPESWVRGFLQVSSALPLAKTKIALDPVDFGNLLFLLKRNKETLGPRSLRFRLKPQEPIEILVEPWNTLLKCQRSIYTGSDSQEIRLWGRRRLLLLERLLPLCKKINVSLLGSGLPSFFEVQMEGMTFTLGLSGWTKNDWSRIGQFDLMAPRGEIQGEEINLLLNKLRETWKASPLELAERTGLSSNKILAGLSLLCQEGKVIFDLRTQMYRLRELSPEPLPLETLRFANDREKEANALKNAFMKYKVEERPEGLRSIGCQQADKKRIQTEILLDGEDRLKQGSCTCHHYYQFKMTQGPCEHMIALRLAYEAKGSFWKLIN